MRRPDVSVLLGGTAVWATLAGAPDLADAQVNCEAIPVGPARTDCYIGLARIGQQKSEIAAGVSRQQTDAAKLRQATGKSPKKKTRRKVRAR
jgi:hypothetical protein